MIREINEKSEEQLAQLKHFYELEKDRLERRLVEEKDRAQKRYNNMVEDYEQKLKEEIENHQDELNNLTDEYKDKEAMMQDYINKLEHDNSLKQ